MIRVQQELERYRHVWPDPVPRAVVDATSYDTHYSPEQIANERDKLIVRPWAGSGHYGKELNLLRSGLKKFALMDDTDLALVHQEILYGKLVVAPYKMKTNSWWIVRPEAMHLMPIADAMPAGSPIHGMMLGYEPEDILGYTKHILAKGISVEI